MRRIAILASVMLLALTGVASGAKPTVVDDGGGGSYPIGSFIIRVYTTDANGNVYWWNCEYLVFDWGTIQNRCW